MSTLVGGVLLLVVLVWLWHRVRRHERVRLRGWGRGLTQPRVAALRRRARPLERFVVARLSPEGYLGLHLTVGALLLMGASGLFGLIVEAILTQDALTVLDHDVAQWLHAQATPPLTTAMFAISALGSSRVVTVIALGTTLLLVWRRAWDRLLALVLTVPGGMLLSVGLKLAFQRGRPSFAEPLLVLTTYSFPSGHALGATVLYGLLATYLVHDLRTWYARLLVAVVGSMVIVVIGVSRLYLGVHYLSDVLGGMAAGVAWLAICLTAVETLRRWRQVRQTARVTPADRVEG